MRLRLLLFLIFFVAFHANADSKEEALAEFIGEGIKKSAPDSVSLLITVRSECEPTPASAQASTDDVVKKIDDYLQTLHNDNDEQFKVLINGGFTSPFSRYLKDKIICKDSFQKSTDIVLKMGMREDFDKTFSEIQNVVLNQFKHGPEVEISEKPTTFVTIGIPYPDLTPEHRKSLEREALHTALDNAIENFKAAVINCEPHRWKIKTMHDNDIPMEFERPRSHLAKFTAALPRPMDNAAPVRFLEIEIGKSLTVGFQFDGSVCFKEDSEPPK